MGQKLRVSDCLHTLMQNNMGPNIGDGLNFVTCVETRRLESPENKWRLSQCVHHKWTLVLRKTLLLTKPGHNRSRYLGEEISNIGLVRRLVVHGDGSQRLRLLASFVPIISVERCLDESGDALLQRPQATQSLVRQTHDTSPSASSCKNISV